MLKSHSFAVILPKTVDFLDFRLFFMEVHSLVHSVFGRPTTDF